MRAFAEIAKRVAKTSIVVFVLATTMVACKTTRQANAPSNIHSDTAVPSIIPYYPLQSDKDLSILINQIGNSRIVLLGEATHGTAEYYQWRAAISRRLIEEKGFNIIAVEGDWSLGSTIDSFITGAPKDSIACLSLLTQFNRWPSWLWANTEVASFINWLNNYNQRQTDNKVRFYGLDLFSFWKPAIDQIPYLQDSLIRKAAKKVQACFTSYDNDALAYTKMVNQHAVMECTGVVQNYRQAVQKYLSEKRAKKEEDFIIEQSALLAVNGEKYFRNPLVNKIDTWNTRENYMAETVKRIIAHYGPSAKAIVWAHNTHVGDAHYSDMFFSGKTNIGELLRKEFGPQQVFITGFGSYSGSFIASERWGDEYKKMEVPAAVPNSFEDMLHKDSAINKIILSKDIKDNKLFAHWVGNRAIGAVNNPWQLGNFIGSLIPKRYDAFIYIDHTHAIHPIDPSLLQSNTRARLSKATKR
jgi:erythromycin esterase-like protein